MKNPVYQHHGCLLLLLLGLAVAAGGCSQPDGKKKAGKGDKPHLVEVVAVTRQDLSLQQVRTGTLRARREVRIYSQEEGTVTALPYFEGDAVKQGDIIVRLDDELLSAETDKARATLRQADQEAARLRKLIKRKLVSTEDMTRAETRVQVASAELRLLETRLGYTRVHAPFDGIVTARLTEPGNVVGRHEHLLTIVDPGSLVTELDVSELVVPHLAVGDIARVSIDALGDQSYEGHITRIHPGIDRLTRRGTLEVELSPVPDGARPGQLCRVHLSSHAAKHLVIPFAAVRYDDKGEYVFVTDSGNKAQRVAIVTGLRFADRVEVLQGLEEGQQIVTRGFLGLSAGKQVKPIGKKSSARVSENATGR